jgi:hypothetical protein
MKFNKRIFGLDYIISYSNYIHLNRPLNFKNLQDEKQIIVIDNKFNPEDYIRLPATPQYPDLLVCQHKIRYDSKIEEVIKANNLEAERIISEENGTKFINSLGWEDGLILNLGLGGFTMNFAIFNNFIKLLKDGADKKIKIYDGKGNVIDSRIADNILGGIIMIREPWRAEWLDNYFSIDPDSSNYMLNYHKLENGKIKRISEVIDKGTLFESQDRKIDLEGYIYTSTLQGLPKQDIGDGNVIYSPPKEDNVAMIRVGPENLSIRCNISPFMEISGVSVRHVRLFEMK